MKKHLLFLFAALLPFVASAQTKVEIDGIWYNLSAETNEAEVTNAGYMVDYGSIIIPATITYDGVQYSVTNIGERAFYSCTSLTSITIPEGVTSIGNEAFHSCDNLLSITIPKSVTSIGSNAFSGCSSLNAVHICNIEAWCKISFSDSYANPLYDAHNLYLNGELVTELVIPEGVTSIGNYTFEHCTNLTTITIPEGVTSIGSYAFSNSGVSGSLTIPFSCKYIGDEAFSYTKITRLHFDMKFSGIDLNNLCTIGDLAFCHCDVLEYVNFQLLLFHIGINPFMECESLVNIEGTRVYTNDECTQGNTLIDGCIYSFVDKEGVSYLELISCPAGKDSYVNPNSSRNELISLGDYAFSGCTKITFLDIPNTVKKIGDYSLVLPRSLDYNDNTYRKIIIPKSVEEFGRNVFAWHGTNWDVYLYGSTSIKNLSVSMFLHKFGNLHILFGTKNEFLENNPSIGHWFNVIDDIGATIIDITLSQSSAKLFEGESITLIATTTPEEAEDSSVTWISSNPSVASVDNNGKVTAIAPGSVTITATANDGSGLSASCEVTVTPASYVITFLIDGEQFYTQTLTRGNTITLPEAPTKEGHTFSGWGEVPETMPADNVTVTGSFTINSYTLTYTVDGKEYNVSTVVYGTELAPLAEPVKEGYTFSGWNEIPATMPADNVVIYGTFAVNKYLVTFKIGDEVIASDSLEYGASIVAPEAPAKEGHTFNGWGEVEETVPAGDVTIEGSYSVNSYLLTFAVDGEVVQSDSIVYGSVITLPEVPTKEGYTFSGWCEVPETMPADNVTVTGRFTINSYTLTYTVDGKGYNVSTVVYGTELAPLAEPVKEGYTFSGWNEIPATMPADNVVIYGTFAVNKYLVTFKVGDEVIAANTLEYDAAIVAPEAPEKEGHTFNGWGDVAETVPAHDVTYEGSYSINSYTLTYVVDGEVVQTLPILYGGSIPSLKEPTKEGYTFSGWSEIPETMPAEDLSIEGTFTRLPSVYLTINQADNGYVKQQLTEGTVCTFTIVAAKGWKIHSVTFNGEDVTSQLEEGSIYTTPEMLEDAVLNIAYEQEVPESVENAHARAIKVRGLDNTIHISGLAEDATVTLYTTNGAMVAHQQSSAGEAKFTVDTNQVYLVHIGDKVVKIGM